MKLLLFNGIVHTPDDPGATAVLIDGDRIAWVGHEGAALAQRDGVDQAIDLQGSLVTPAFVDAHVHTTATGMHLTGLDLSEARSAEHLLELVQEHCQETAAGDVVVGHGWDESAWVEPILPTRAQLDTASGGAALYLTRVDVHSALATTTLLDLIPEVTQLPGFDAVGPLRSDAHHAARRAILDRISDDQRSRWQEQALAHFAAAGVAAVHEMAGPDISSHRDLRALLARDAGTLVSAYWGELGAAQQARDLGAVGAGGDLFADGALGSRTAWLSEPYADAPQTSGVAHVSSDAVAEHVVECAEVGVQAGFHVIGDEALAEVLRGFRAAAERVGEDVIRAGRHRLEHVEMPAAAHFVDLARLGITASVQPQFDALWGGADGMYAARLGVARAQPMNPFRDFVTQGIALAFGSDTPVTTVTPWHTVAAAVFHQSPESRISARAAFNSHTRGGWRAVGVDDAGVIRPGFGAHVAVWRATDLDVQAPDDRVAAWSTDPRSGTPPLPTLTPEGPYPQCLATVAAGRITFTDGSLV